MSAQPTTTLTELQRQVILTLAKGATVKDAADAAGLHRTTIYNWIKSSQEFDDAFGAAQALHLAELSDRMEELTTISISTLREILQDPKAPAAVRLRAALAVLKANFFSDPGFNRKSLGPHFVAGANDGPSDPPEIIEKIEKAQEECVEIVESVENVEFSEPLRDLFVGQSGGDSLREPVQRPAAVAEGLLHNPHAMQHRQM